MIIEVTALSKDYGSLRALNGLTFNVEAGGVVGLLGPNGAGKTTLLETLEGLRSPTSGAVAVLGMDPMRRARTLRERIGVQLQSVALPHELTPLETLKLFGHFYSRSCPPAQVLAMLGLNDKARSRNDTLSGGQQRRLAIGMALLNDPELVILDEPTGGLDPVSRREIHAVVTALRAEGRTVLLSTHQVEEAEMLCDRVILLRHGTIVADGTPFELVSRARGSSTLWIAVEGAYDPHPLIRAGAVAQGNEGGYHRFSLTDTKAVILALGELLQNGHLKLIDLRLKQPNLEDVYLDLMESAAVRQGGDSWTDSAA